MDRLHLRRLAIALLVWYAVQFIAGMTLNLFVTLPTTHPGTVGADYFARSGASLLWALAGSGGPALLIHAWIAVILLIGAVALFVQSLRRGGRGWRLGSGIATFFTLNEDFSSAIMAGCWLIAVAAVITPLIRTSTRRTAQDPGRLK
jgi:hypothetical protein